MANYDRKILVPYLCDVCSTEMLCAKLEKEINQCNCDIYYHSNAVQKVVDPEPPEKPEYGLDYIGILFASLLMIGGIYVASLCGKGFFANIMLLFCGFPGFMIFIAVALNNKEKNSKYSKELEHYKYLIEKNEKIRKDIPFHQLSLQNSQRQLGVLQSQLADAQKLRSEVYGVNIIPGKYRDKYVAYYLYDYFSTSRETDLDKIIQTLLLDEIRQKLEDIIAQNEEIILNQRYQIALQERQIQTMEKNHLEELQHIARLERNQELQMDYQNMIARNQEVTNFILAADYIRKY